MKTEQEQVEEMTDIIKAKYKEWLDATGVIPEGTTYYAECLGVSDDCAELLVKAGYGDVSEYKAEIERLKAENNELNKKNWSLEEELKKKELEITYARNNGYEKGYDECEEYMKDKIKQAKIDVLNDLKDRASQSTFWENGYIPVRYLIELIKEVDV